LEKERSCEERVGMGQILKVFEWNKNLEIWFKIFEIYFSNEQENFEIFFFNLGGNKFGKKAQEVGFCFW